MDGTCGHGSFNDGWWRWSIFSYTSKTPKAAVQRGRINDQPAELGPNVTHHCLRNDWQWGQNRRAVPLIPITLDSETALVIGCSLPD